MCGITGLIKLNGDKITDRELTIFTDSLSHRGPDGSGGYINEKQNLGLGHRRLSIIDLSNEASQPMKSFCGRYVIVFNGEVFNYIEIKKELESSGVKFRTESDTEVIIESYIKWGKDCFNRFNGMWALALYDIRDNKLLLCRDRFGIKPLYYTFESGVMLAFSSEHGSFKSLAMYSREFNLNNLHLAIADDFPLEGSGHTIYKNTYQLFPGHFIEIDPEQVQIHQKRWWNLYDQLVEIPSGFEDQSGEFLELFKDACNIRMRSDVPVGTALSGGVDSSSVFGTLNKFGNHKSSNSNIHTPYFKAFEEDFLNETKYAEAVAKMYKADLKYIYAPKEKIADAVVSSTLHFDTISSSPLNVLTDIYKAMKSDGVKVSIEGHGVDEMLFGYHTMLAELYDSADADQQIREDALHTLRGLSERKISVYNRVEARLKNIFNKKKTEIFFFPGHHLFSGNSSLPEELSDAPYNYKKEQPFRRIIGKNFNLTELPNNLRDFDRASMMHGVEVRMPFLDYRLVKFVFSLSANSVIRNGYTKAILRESMTGIIPELVRLRKWKVGIQAPIVGWMNNELRQLTFDLVTKQNLNSIGLQLDEADINDLYSKYRKKQLSNADLSVMWKLVNALIIKKGNESNTM